MVDGMFFRRAPIGRRIGNDVQERRGERHDVARSQQAAGVGDHPRQIADVGGHDRQPARQRLEHDVRHAFVVGGQDENGGVAQQRRHVARAAPDRTRRASAASGVPATRSGPSPSPASTIRTSALACSSEGRPRSIVGCSSRARCARHRAPRAPPRECRARDGARRGRAALQPIDVDAVGHERDASGRHSARVHHQLPATFRVDEHAVRPAHQSRQRQPAQRTGRQMTVANLLITRAPRGLASTA